MDKSTRLMVVASIGALAGVFALPAANHPGGGAGAAGAHGPVGAPGVHGPAGAPGARGAPAAFRGPEGGVAHGPGGPGHVHAIGERGYSFRGPEHGRRDIVTFNERERGIWMGGRWHHERRFGRLGYWWEVNGAWYYYDMPMGGPPAYVSEVEFFDDADPGAPVLVEQPAVVVAPPVVVVAPRPVYVPPPVVCVGPLCVR
jgi:hypothetical protein